MQTNCAGHRQVMALTPPPRQPASGWAFGVVRAILTIGEDVAIALGQDRLQQFASLDLIV